MSVCQHLHNIKIEIFRSKHQYTALTPWPYTYTRVRAIAIAGYADTHNISARVPRVSVPVPAALFRLCFLDCAPGAGALEQSRSRSRKCRKRAQARDLNLVVKELLMFMDIWSYVYGLATSNWHMIFILWFNGSFNQSTKSFQGEEVSCKFLVFCFLRQGRPNQVLYICSPLFKTI